MHLVRLYVISDVHTQISSDEDVFHYKQSYHVLTKYFNLEVIERTLNCIFFLTNVADDGHLNKKSMDSQVMSVD